VLRFPLSTPHPLLPAVPAEKRKLTTSTFCRIADKEAFSFSAGRQYWQDECQAAHQRTRRRKTAAIPARGWLLF